MDLLLDTGALISVDKGDRKVMATLEVAQRAGLSVRTGATVVAQAWRDGSRQVNLARVLAGVDVRPLDPDQAREVGELLAATETADVVDAHVAVLAAPGDRILTSDRAPPPPDLERLLQARGVEALPVGV